MAISEKQTSASSQVGQKHEKYERKLERAKALTPLPTAVAHPCDESSLSAAVDAARIGLMAPLLVGPGERSKAVAEKAGMDLGGLEIIEAPHSHGSAARAVELVREGRAEPTSRHATCSPRVSHSSPRRMRPGSYSARPSKAVA